MFVYKEIERTIKDNNLPFQKIEDALQKDIDEGVKEWINEFIEEQKEE